jgi:hypothetical protein
MLVLKRKFSAFLFTVLFTLSFGGWAQAGIACYSAHALPPSLAKLERILERKVQVEHLPPRGGFYQVDLYTNDWELKLGSLLYQPRANGQIIQISIIDTRFQRFGIGQTLVEQALMKFPNTKIIGTWVLKNVNKRELKKALKRGATPVEALQQTPSYKIGAALGFTKIIPETITEDFDFAVQKPTPSPRDR